jgi:hypothetical protein
MRASFLTLASSMLITATAILPAETVAGLTWTPPAGWTSKAATQMRAATYVLAENAECVVYFFGAGQGGSVEANVDRWKGQFTTPDGKPAQAKITKITVHNLPVTTIEVSGQYSGMGGPMAKTQSVASGFRLLGAIVEGPGGNVFLKFTGPAALVAQNEVKFKQLLDSFGKAAN